MSSVSQLSGPGVADPIKGRAERDMGFLQIPMALPRADSCHRDPSPSAPVVHSIMVHHTLQKKPVLLPTDRQTDSPS